ncbi:MAG: macro domain-containing protein [Synergistaceae bacterium]|nr:macro domain-containing protein [Synergistaceae bacterium]
MKLKIYLRDTNNEIVHEWERIFSACSDVFISCGNIFNIKDDAIISPGNSFGFMDGGIDRYYSEYFGWDLQKQLQNKIRNEFFGELPVGMATIIETGDTTIKYLISCPTMRVPEDVSKTANAYLAFRAGLIGIIKFNQSSDKDKISSVLCPGLGTLTGRITPENCAIQMKYAYDSIINKNITFPNDLLAAERIHLDLIR